MTYLLKKWMNCSQTSSDCYSLLTSPTPSITLVIHIQAKSLSILTIHIQIKIYSPVIQLVYLL